MARTSWSAWVPPRRDAERGLPKTSGETPASLFLGFPFYGLWRHGRPPHARVFLLDSWAP